MIKYKFKKDFILYFTLMCLCNMAQITDFSKISVLEFLFLSKGSTFNKTKHGYAQRGM